VQRYLDAKGGKKAWKNRPPVRVETEVKDDGLVRHQEIARAHSDAIMSIVLADDFIYTASRDKTLKRWKPGKNAANRFELTVDVVVQLGDLCCSMVYVGEWLFCGLGAGTIRGYAKSGKEADLRGHTKRVSALVVHQGVLVSGSSDMTVRVWQAGEPGPFTCTHKIDEGVPGACTALCPLGTNLWVGGTSGVALLELASLRITQQIMPKKTVAGFLEFQGHVIVAYSEGSLCIFDPAGTQKHSQAPTPAGPLLCLAGLSSGPRVLLGHARGQVSSITLPMFHLKKYWQAFERHKVQTICCTPEGIFLLGCENGDLQLWQRDDVADL